MTNETPATILNVNDDDAMRYLIARQLRGAGFRVLEAASGTEALNLLAESPHLLVLDVNLPDISGFEICRRIKANPTTASTLVLHLSASFVTGADLAYGLEGGADAYLTLPVEEPVLIATVRSLLRLRRAEEAVLAAAAEQRRFLRDVLSSVTEGRLRLCDSLADLPMPLAEAAAPLPISCEAVSRLRREVDSVALAQEMPPERRQDLLTAVSEAATNAVKHGGGGLARIRAGDGRVQVWIEDEGKGIAMENLPLATLERGYTTTGTLGHGFWLILRTADRLWLLTRESGTTWFWNRASRRTNRSGHDHRGRRATFTDRHNWVIIHWRRDALRSASASPPSISFSNQHSHEANCPPHKRSRQVMFGIQKQLSGRVLMLRCKGPLNGEALSPEQVLSTVKSRGIRLLLIDATQASFIDSDGLRWLQRLREKLAEAGSSLRIAARPKGKVWRTLRLFNYDKDMYDSPARAWKSEWRLQPA